MIHWIIASETGLTPGIPNGGIPTKFVVPNAVTTETLCVPGSLPPVPRSGGAVRPQPPKLKTPTSPQKRALTGAKPVKPKQPQKVAEEEDEDEAAFSGSAPVIDRADVNVNIGLPENEEEELELIYVEALGCYYCPNNQQYYQIDDRGE
jgi:hypothetical protein